VIKHFFLQYYIKFKNVLYDFRFGPAALPTMASNLVNFGKKEIYENTQLRVYNCPVGGHPLFGQKAR
jgi:hypothetical protein